MGGSARIASPRMRDRSRRGRAPTGVGRAALALLVLCFPFPASAQEPSVPATTANGTAPAAEPIPLASPDGEIATRLRGIFANVDGLEDVTVQVKNGVVRLGGTTLTGQERQRAAEIAGRLANVVEVDDRITAETRVSRRVAPEVERARNWGHQALAHLPLVLVALLVVFAFWLIGRLLTRVVRPFRRLAPNRFIEDLFGQAVRFGFTLAGLVVAMNILGLSALLTSVLGAAGVFGLAIGFAVRDTIENYIASILLSLRQPFEPGDHVLIEGFEGNIALLNSRATVLVTLDGNEVRIPNATVYKTVITNFTHLPERRFDFEVGIGSDEDIGRALTLANETVRQVEGVLDKPAAVVLVDRLSDHGTVLKVLGWVDQRNSDLSKVRSRALREIRAAFVGEGVSFPVATSEVRLTQQPSPEREVPPSEEAERPELSDTRPDPTIRQKAEAIRASSDTDLLDRKAARE